MEAVKQSVVADPATFVRAYLSLLEKDGEADLVRFLNLVPESLREAVFERIDRALANSGD